MRILALSGSLRKQSYNTALLKAMRELHGASLKIEIYDGLGSIPAFDPMLSDNQVPSIVDDIIEKMTSSSGIIICTPEYAHGIPGALKNTLDWLVNSVELVLKPVAVMSVSTSGLGGYRAHSSLIQVLSAMNWNVVIEASLSLPYAKNRFDQNLTLTDAITRKRLDVSLSAFRRAIDESGP